MKVGMIINPFSGKDIRRITSQASVVGNTEKERKVIRMINAMAKFGVEKVVLMPDSYGLNLSIKKRAEFLKIPIEVELLDYVPTDKDQDTIKAVEIMIQEDVKCLIVLGGDGTSRLVAKTKTSIPVIPVSTGTNNAYPKFLEGTTVGIAAAYIAKGNQSVLGRDKKISIFVNDHIADIAIVEAVVTSVPFVGSRAVSGIDEIKEILVCKCSPELIGLSSIIGSSNVCEDIDDFAYYMKIALEGKSVLAPLNSGDITEITYSDLIRLGLDEAYVMTPDYPGTIALDGERTVAFRENDEIKFIVKRDGLNKVDVTKTLYKAAQDGFMHVQKNIASDQVPGSVSV
jgi:predicted polyphosphate/ATP-dependent NAD kinase